MTSPANPGREGGRRRRRKPRRKSAAPPSAVEVLAKAGTESVAEATEVPMSPAEVARMKGTLRFLREHRNILKLKVNAAEDLLLNGRREPTHRGVCQHLLSKLDRARVIAASERLAPAEATELLAGIVRFAPEVPYILRFLQCVKASANRAETAAALTQALEQLDLRETSPAQLRDILLLIVEVFPAQQLPVFVLTLLEREEVQVAIERSRETFPEELARLLLPLGALHTAVGRGAAARHKGGERLARERVEEGARLLLESGSLAELAEPLRRRLLPIGCDAVARAPEERRKAAPDALVALFRGLSFRDPAARATAAWRVVSALLAARRDDLARRVLAEDFEGSSDVERAKRWTLHLAAARVGNVALDRPRAREHGRRKERPANGHALDAEAEVDRWQRGFHLPTQRDVLVRTAAAPAEALLSHAALRRRASVPGIAPVLEDVAPAQPPVAAPTTQEAAGSGELLAYAVASPGPTLESKAERGASSALVVAWCKEAVRILHALALAGIELPDAAARRFNVDESGRLWLTDLWGATAPSTPTTAHVAHARDLCVRLLEALPIDIVPAFVAEKLNAATSAGELLDALEGLS